MTHALTARSRPTPAWNQMFPVKKDDKLTIMAACEEITASDSVLASPVSRFHCHRAVHEGIAVHTSDNQAHYRTIWDSFFDRGYAQGERAFKITENGSLVGLIHYAPIKAFSEKKGETKAVIDVFHVKPERIGRGYRMSLFNFAFRRLQEQGVSTLYIRAHDNSTTMQDFFDKQHAVAVDRDGVSTLYEVDLQAAKPKAKRAFKRTAEAVPV